MTPRFDRASQLLGTISRKRRYSAADSASLPSFCNATARAAIAAGASDFAAAGPGAATWAATSRSERAIATSPIVAQYDSSRRPSMRNGVPLTPALLAALALPSVATSAEEPKPLAAKGFAQRVEVTAAPVHPFRYNQPLP